MSLFSCCFGTGGRHTSSAGLHGGSLSAAASNLTKIFEELKCPICFNVCVPPIHNCMNGHIVCNTCKQRGNVTVCPTCREGLMGARNIFAENFIQNYAQQCRYASQGCEHIRLKGCSMRPHEEKCMFRPLKCIVDTCGLILPYKTILSHLDFAHKASGTDKLPTTIQFQYNTKKNRRKRRWVPYYIHAFGNVYYVMMEQFHKNNAIWVYSQTCKESTELEYAHYAYIKLRHPEKKIAQSWYGPVYPIRTPKETVMTDGCCFMLPRMILKNFTSGGMLSVIVDIRKTPRRSLRGIKISSDDSVTAMAPSLPAEYNRPPCFYDPSMPPSLMPPPQFEPKFDDNGNSIIESPSDATSINQLKPLRARTAACAMWNAGHSSSPSPAPVSSTGSTIIKASNSVFDTNLNMLSLNNDDGDLPEKNCIDKIPSQVTFSSNSVNTS